MTSKDFDYEGFAKNLAEQAKKVMPNDISEKAKNYLVSTMEEYTKIAGYALYNDKSLGFDENTIMFISQIIAEWTLHKCIDLAHSAIPMDYWDGILQKIAFTMFEIAKQGCQNEVPEDKLLQYIEYQVRKVWKASIKDLLKSYVISEEEANAAKKLSNFNDIAKEYGKTEEEIEEEDDDDDNMEDDSENNDDFEMTEIDIESDWRSEGDNTDNNNEIDYEKKN